MDLRLASRQLRRSPGFAALAIGVLAIGIGSNTALFSVIHGVLLRPLAYNDPDKIVALATRWLNNPKSPGAVSGPDFADWRDRGTAFASVAAYNSGGAESSVVTRHGALYAYVRSVTKGFDAVFGVPPAQGRWFTPEAGAEAVVSYAFAQRALGGNALGESLKISERVSTIVGVMPPGFRFPDKTEIWTFAGTDLEKAHRTGHNWRVVARLKSSATLDQATAQMDVVGEQIAREYPKENSQKRVAVIPLKERLVGDVRLMLWVLFGAVALVLLIACANVANLLLSRAHARTKEMAVRAALGAGRARIVRQLLTESLLLAVAGGVLGIGVAFATLKALAALAPANLPRLDEIRIDPLVLLFSLVVSVLATLVFGLAPAWKASRVDLNEALKQSGGRGSTRSRLPRALVVGEVAVATVLAIGAGLLARSFSNLFHTELGFQTRKVLVADARVMSTPEISQALRKVHFYHETLDEVRRLPGVEAAAGIRGMPGEGLYSNGSYGVRGGENAARRSASAQNALFTTATPAYFSTMGIRLHQGRDFSLRDTYDASFVAIVNRALVRQAFPDGDAIGKQIQCGLDSDKWMTIVGVVDDARSEGPASKVQQEIYMPALQHPRPAQFTVFVVRTANPAALHQPIRQLVARRDPEVPVKFTTVDAVVSENVAAPRFRTMLLGAMALLAVVLAMAGVYGVMAYAVGRRMLEFGVRAALGASPGELMRMVMSEGASLAVAGLAIGVAAALAGARLLETMVFGLTTRDAATYAGVATMIALVALAASLVPAWRAGRVDPVVALREE